MEILKRQVVTAVIAAVEHCGMLVSIVSGGRLAKVAAGDVSDGWSCESGCGSREWLLVCLADENRCEQR